MNKTLRSRSWFDKGGRHGLQNRVADLSLIFEGCDLREFAAVDLGAAEGDISIWLSKRFRHVTAVELMDKAYNALVERVSEVPNVTPVHADVRGWEPDQKYDCVFLLGVLHFFPDDAQKKETLERVLSGAKYGCFVRTGIREHKLREGWSPDNVQKYTPVGTFREVADRFGFEIFILDNAWRGRGDARLGDLVYYRKPIDGNPLPSVAFAKEVTGGRAL